ncbi:Restriction endonuclease [uncultured archaeon]|nr:Restriction endonuclease [uncultured archaeon]
MKQTVESMITQANTWFLAGNTHKALLSYHKALQQAKALTIIENYIQKNKDDIFEDQDLLKELLHTKYHIRLVPGAISAILLSIKKQVEEKEQNKAYQRFKKNILSKNPKTPEQYVDALLQQNEKPSWQEMTFLSNMLLEHRHIYYVCDVDQLCHNQIRALELARFERSLREKKPEKFSEIDTMTGHEFEEFLIDLFTKMGYSVERKKQTHEQGLDLLLTRYGEKTAVQVKRYNKPVGNKAVQEANAARVYYRCQRALVVTNSRFTSSAKQLAERCDVELWDRKQLKEKIKTIK